MMVQPSHKLCNHCGLYITKSDVSKLKKEYPEYENIDFMKSMINCPRCYIKNEVKSPLILCSNIPDSAERLNESRPVKSPQVHIMFNSTKTPM